MTAFGGEVVGQGYVEIHAVAAPGLNSEISRAATSGANSLNKALAPALKNAANGVNGLEKSMKGVTPAVESVSNRVKGAATSVAGFMQKAAGGITAVVTAATAAGAAVGFFGIKAAASFETTQTALKGLEPVLGDSGAAFDKLQHFAAVTPFTFDQVKTSAVQLATSLKTDLAGSLKVLETLGNAGAAVGATSDQIGAASKALAQLSARGKFNAQDLMQITSAIPSIASVDIIAEIAKQLHVTNQEASDLANQGAVSAKVGIAAILSVAEKVPGAFGAMDRQAQTFSGRMSTLHDTIQLVLATAFTPLLKVIEDELGVALKGGTDNLAAFGEQFGKELAAKVKEALPAVKELAGDVGDLAGAIIPVIGFFADLTRGLARLVNLLKDGDIGGIVQGIAAGLLRMVGLGIIPDIIESIGDAIGSLTDRLPKWLRGYETAAEKTGRLNQAALDASPALRELASTMHLDTNTADLLAAATTAAADAIAALPKDVQPIFKGGGLLGVNTDGTAAFIQNQLDAKKAAEDSTEGISAALQSNVDKLDKVRSASDSLKASEKALADLRKVTGQQLRDDITKAELGLTTARRGVAEAADRVTAAELTLTQAKRGVGAADERLAQLTKERSALLADTTREARELADAESTLAHTKAELVDQEEAEQALRRDIADLGTEGPEALAAADRAILRAKIALNTATREEKELQDSLNASQTTALDLGGLSLDQIKTKLAGARAQLAVQRATKSTAKTAQQIEDEALGKKLTVLDAEQGLKDATKTRLDLEIDQGIQKRENEEALQGLALDHENSLRRQTEQQQTLSRLRAGDTDTARTLKGLNDEIADATDGITTAALALKGAEQGVLTAKDGQLTAVLGIRDAEIQVRDAKDKQRQHSVDIATSEQKIREDAQKLDEATANTLGSSIKINDALLARIGLNSTLLNQNPELTKNLVNTLLGPAKFGPFLPGSQAERDAQLRQQRGNQLQDILLNHPDQLLSFLRSIGLPFAQGGIVNRDTLARIGEAGREAILPLTRPARLDQLLGDPTVLPPVLAALDRISPRRGNGPSSARSVEAEKRRERDALADAIVSKMSAAGMMTGSGAAPITFHVDQTAPTTKLSERELERSVKRALGL